MIFYAALFIGFFVLAFILRRKRFIFYNLAENAVSLLNEMLSVEDEDEKIAGLQKYTNRLLTSLLKTILLLAIALLIGLLPAFLYSLATDQSFVQLEFESTVSILVISVGASLPFILPLGKKSKSDYSELSQLLHRLALNNYRLADKLFQREKKSIKKHRLKSRNDFVIISGLARAGTTSLMNDLAKLSPFVSLSYANMPFLTAPQLWRKFYKPKSDKKKERSHKDGIMIGQDSNEALEEYFFKLKANNSYISDNSLSEYSLTEADYKDYLDYQTIIRGDDKKIYLAKNNNFLLRYESMRIYNEAFLMVILFRQPLAHASSLLEKHLDYSKLQKEDPFVLEYMDWLGHHEFGLHQKPFEFEGSTTTEDHDKTTLDYWLSIWINYYQHVLLINHPRTMLVDYADYCKRPDSVIETISRRLELQVELPEYKSFDNKRQIEADASPNLVEEAQDVYRKLKGR